MPGKEEEEVDFENDYPSFVVFVNRGGTSPKNKTFEWGRYWCCFGRISRSRLLASGGEMLYTIPNMCCKKDANGNDWRSICNV